MALTFENLIAHNKRVSLFLVTALVALTALLGGMVGTVFGGMQSHPSLGVVPIGTIAGASLALVGAGISFFAGQQIIMALNGGQPLEKSADPELFNVVEEMAIAAGIPPPAVFLIEDPSPNAFATGRDTRHAAIGITSGLRQKLTRDELQAVIAHETAHIHNFDTRLMMLVAVFAGCIVLVADFFLRTARYTGRNRNSDSDTSFGRAAPAVAMVFWIVAVILALVAPPLAKMLQLAVSREREYLADATAIKLCRNPLALVSALQKISDDPAPLQNDNRALQHLFIVNPAPRLRLTRANWDSIWATHPPLVKRIARIQALAGHGGE